MGSKQEPRPQLSTDAASESGWYEARSVSSAALLGRDYHGINFELLCEQGDRVKAGHHIGSLVHRLLGGLHSCIADVRSRGVCHCCLCRLAARRKHPPPGSRSNTRAVALPVVIASDRALHIWERTCSVTRLKAASRCAVPNRGSVTTELSAITISTTTVSNNV